MSSFSLTTGAISAHEYQTQELELPLDAQILSVMCKACRDSTLYLTARYSAVETDIRKFRCYPSDSYIDERKVPEGAKFIGSVDRYGTLVHVFEVFE